MNDKTKHFIAGALAGLFGGLLTLSTGDGFMLGAVVVSLGAGICKELHDSTGRGAVDVWDALFTLAGGLTTALAYELLKLT